MATRHTPSCWAGPVTKRDKSRAKLRSGMAGLWTRECPSDDTPQKMGLPYRFKMSEFQGGPLTNCSVSIVRTDACPTAPLC